MSDDRDEDQEFWFNTQTKKVEQGRQSHYTHLMGPYPTLQAAEQALTTAATRNDSWDDEDDRWDRPR